MDIVLGGRTEAFVEQLVQAGTYPSAHAVIEDALRQQELKLAALRAKLEAADASGDTTDEEIDEHLAMILHDLRKEGL